MDRTKDRKDSLAVECQDTAWDSALPANGLAGFWDIGRCQLFGKVRMVRGKWMGLKVELRWVLRCVGVRRSHAR